MNRKNLGLAAAAGAMLVLILDSRGAAYAASQGVEVCIRTVIPSLFPFFLLSGYLTVGLGGIQALSFLARIFRASTSCGTVIAAGLLGGYPLGAKLAAEGYRGGSISKQEADRLLFFCSQAGPSFLFGMVAAQFPDAKYAWMLWSIQLISAFSVAWLVPPEQENSSRLTVPSKKPDAMRSALTAMASVCGWVIVFGVILHFLKRWFLWLLPQWVQVLLCGLMELTNGCLLLQSVDSLSLRIILAAVMLNFGGLCVMMQTASLIQGLKLRNYLCGKIMQTFFAAACAGAMVGKKYFLIPVFWVFSWKILLNRRKRGSIPEKIGV